MHRTRCTYFTKHFEMKHMIINSHFSRREWSKCHTIARHLTIRMVGREAVILFDLARMEHGPAFSAVLACLDCCVSRSLSHTNKPVDTSIRPLLLHSAAISGYWDDAAEEVHCHECCATRAYILAKLGPVCSMLCAHVKPRQQSQYSIDQHDTLHSSGPSSLLWCVGADMP